MNIVHANFFLHTLCICQTDDLYFNGNTYTCQCLPSLSLQVVLIEIMSRYCTKNHNDHTFIHLVCTQLLNISFYKQHTMNLLELWFQFISKINLFPSFHIPILHPKSWKTDVYCTSCSCHATIHIYSRWSSHGGRFDH